MFDEIPSVHELDSEECKRNFYFFVKKFWHVIIPEEPHYNWHIEYLCKELQAIAVKVKRREPKESDLIINIPPGTSKSTICTIMFPAWCWAIDPTLRILTASYSATLSTNHAIKSRDIIKSDLFQSYFPGIDIRYDQDNKMHYMNEQGGERYVTSVGGAVTGFHAHIIIVDDPINQLDSTSTVKRFEANNFMDSTLSTRKVDKELTPTILIMQRLHDLDPTGNMLSKPEKKVKHICLPGELSDKVRPVELCDRYMNGLLDTVRLNRNALQGLRVDLGTYGYAGQIMQTPHPDEGGILKKSFFPIITHEEFNTKVKDKKIVWEFFMDTAYTDKTKNDPSALMSVCLFENNAYIKRSKTVWLELPELITEIKLFVASEGYTSLSRIFVEPKASGLSVVQTIKKETGLNIISLDPPKDSKVTRVQSASPVLESKRVFLIEGNWNTNFIEEAAAFPNGSHDDQVDNLTAMVNKFLSKGVPTMAKFKST